VWQYFIAMDKTQLRLDPLSREWTIFSEARALPPTFGSVKGEKLADSPFRAGLERFAPHALHQDGGEFGWQVRVVPNRLPVLRVEGDHVPNGDGFYQHLDGVGAHEIVVEDPGSRAFEDLPVADAARVVNAWRVRIEDLMRDMRLRTFCVVKSVGAVAGQTIAHSVSQVFALAVIPAALHRELESAREYFVKKKHSLFADLIEHERRNAVRIVHENDGFLAFCPYAARTSFEVAIWPKRPGPDFHRIGHEDAAQFASALLVVMRKLNKALDHPPIQFSLTTAPSRQPGSFPTIEQDYRWHATIAPRLHPPGAIDAATGCHVNGVWPEVAADFLRQQEVQP
jgi:UDPglucose--hexose-1-phosphate uridylyltransferase